MTDKQRYELMLSIKSQLKELKEEKENDEKVFQIAQKGTYEFYDYLLSEIFMRVDLFKSEFKFDIRFAPTSSLMELGLEETCELAEAYNDRNKDNQICAVYAREKVLFILSNLLVTLAKEDNIEMNINKDNSGYDVLIAVDNLFDIAQSEYESYYTDMIYRLKVLAKIPADLEQKDTVSKRNNGRIHNRDAFNKELTSIAEKILISAGESETALYNLKNHQDLVLEEIQSIKENYLGQSLKRQISELKKYS